MIDSRIIWLLSISFLSCFTRLSYLFLAFFIVTTTFNNIFYKNNFNSKFTLSNCCLENINININNFNTSLCLTNNVFWFSQKEIVSVSFTPSSSITSYNPLIFYFIQIGLDKKEIQLSLCNIFSIFILNDLHLLAYSYFYKIH